MSNQQQHFNVFDKYQQYQGDEDDEEEEHKMNMEFQKYLPKDMNSNLETQRLFAEDCMKKAGGFGRFQWLACLMIVLGTTSSALIT